MTFTAQSQQLVKKATSRRRTLATYTLALPGRPLTVNKERTMHFHARSDELKGWRVRSARLADAMEIPRMERVKITACPWLTGKRKQDVAACLPSVKAAIDGLVDAGVLDDDTPEHVLSLSFLPPALGAEVDELVLTIEEAR